MPAGWPIDAKSVRVKLLEHVDLPLEKIGRDKLKTRAEKGPGWQRGNAARMVAMIDRGRALPASYRAPVALWQFGGDLTLVALPGEVVVDYVYGIEKAIGPLRLLPAAYCNDYFGYLPSKRVIQEGGYENRGLNSGAGWFAPEAEDAMVAKVRELAEKTKRPAGGSPQR